MMTDFAVDAVQHAEDALQGADFETLKQTEPLL
jgi:hypothetical protein